MSHNVARTFAICGRSGLEVGCRVRGLGLHHGPAEERSDQFRAGYTVYVLLATRPPVPVQLVWKNWPRGWSTRS